MRPLPDQRFTVDAARSPSWDFYLAGATLFRLPAWPLANWARCSRRASRGSCASVAPGWLCDSWICRSCHWNFQRCDDNVCVVSVLECSNSRCLRLKHPDRGLQRLPQFDDFEVMVPILSRCRVSDSKAYRGVPLCRRNLSHWRLESSPSRPSERASVLELRCECQHVV